MKCSKCLKIIPPNEEISGRKGGFYCEECWKSKFEYRYYEESGKKSSGNSGSFIFWGIVIILALVMFLFLVIWLTVWLLTRD